MLSLVRKFSIKSALPNADHYVDRLCKEGIGKNEAEQIIKSLDESLSTKYTA